MNNLRHTANPLPIEAGEKATESSVPHAAKNGLEMIDNNPKVDIQLLTAYYRTKLKYERLRAAGFVRNTQGANYRLSHPLADRDMPTDAMHRSEPPNEEERGAQEYPRYRLSHPLADRDMPTDAMHRSESPNEDAEKSQTPVRRGYRR